jgi:hypothetical protein
MRSLSSGEGTVDCRGQGLPYICLMIPGAGFNVVIEPDDPQRPRS